VSKSSPRATSTPAESPDPGLADPAAHADDPAVGASDGTGDAPIPGLGYEEAREELIDVVRRLESGGTTLEESLALWERGEALARTCQHWLDGARRRLDAATDRDTAAT
jgi:exodeoxyribonuclease VII small subunit